MHICIWPIVLTNLTDFKRISFELPMITLNTDEMLKVTLITCLKVTEHQSYSCWTKSWTYNTFCLGEMGVRLSEGNIGHTQKNF